VASLRRKKGSPFTGMGGVAEKGKKTLFGMKKGVRGGGETSAKM